MSELKKKDKVYYARILPHCSVYDICELTIRTVEDDWFVGIDKQDKHAYLFNDTDLNNTVFLDRNIALKKVQTAESQKREVSNETYYEEY